MWPGNHRGRRLPEPARGEGIPQRVKRSGKSDKHDGDPPPLNKQRPVPPKTPPSLLLMSSRPTARRAGTESPGAGGVRKVPAGEPAEEPFAAGRRRRTGRKRAAAATHASPSALAHFRPARRPRRLGLRPAHGPGGLAPARCRRACPLLCLQTKRPHTLHCVL